MPFKAKIKILAVILLVAHLALSRGALAAADDDDALLLDSATWPEVNILVNVLPPYVVEGADGKPAGAWVDKMRAFVEARGVRPKFMFHNWRRGLLALEKEPDVMLAHVDRVPDREDKYLWIFPLEEKTYNIIARNEPAYGKVTHESWMEHGGKTACVRNTHSCDILRNLGYSEDKILEIYDLNYSILGPMLYRGRMTFLIEDFSWQMEANQAEEENPFISLFSVASVTTYLAAGPNLSPELAARLISKPNALDPTDAPLLE